ncbi:hypothetical protein MKW98_021257 [Papaver atlanticum]|uniref:Uncharacterized protein n=1 Tax=Papaver atlanticum TaxID=357466 RepID=A0AAD4SHV3_9MAGN|nr:hypothetical protein MKW98_021257 [Papaver atlanticum]
MKLVLQSRVIIQQWRRRYIKFVYHQIKLSSNLLNTTFLRYFSQMILFTSSRIKNHLKKFLLGIQYFFPILEWGSEYSFKLLKSDVISGLTIAIGKFASSLWTIFKFCPTIAVCNSWKFKTFSSRSSINSITSNGFYA